MQYFAVGVLILVGIIALAWFVRRSKRSFRSRDFRMEDREAWQERWQGLEAMLDDNPAHWPSAIIEADKLFDSVLKTLHLPGKDTGERFQFLMRDRPHLRYVRAGRMLRNRVVHESTYVLDRRSAHEAIAAYRHALKDLGIL